jgi:hypothetical protein
MTCLAQERNMNRTERKRALANPLQARNKRPKAAG